MKKSIITNTLSLAFLALIISVSSSCKKEENPIKFPNGTVPDTVTTALSDINSEWDDYNMSLYELYDNISLLFSSNRGSSGGQFDLVQGALTFTWDQTTGVFGYGSEMTSDAFLTALTTAANTPGNDFGPYRFFSKVDGKEYLFLASEITPGNLDIYYLYNMPKLTSALPAISGPHPATLLNTAGNDAYISLNLNTDTVYYCSDYEGDFDIYLKKRPAEKSFAIWLSESYSAGTAVDSLNSDSNDKCPFVDKKVMVFSSNRPGGFGNYDLYYSVFRNGKWSSPENFGPDVNTAYDEYRPIIGTFPNYTNSLLLFSSNRPGGKGGFDLYFRGVTIDKN